MATLKVYADRKSQPTRAVLLFCKYRKRPASLDSIKFIYSWIRMTIILFRCYGIEFEEVQVELFKGEHKTPQFQAINPMKQVPAITHGDFKLFESHAILIYLASAFKVADHWYPADIFKRAKLHSLLDWHHSNLRKGAMGYLLNTVLAPVFGISSTPQAVAATKETLISSLSSVENFWLQGNGKFLLGDDKPSIADLSLLSELMQLEMLDENERSTIMGPYNKVRQWMEDTKKATSPHFEEIHKVLFETVANLKKQAS